MEFGRLKALVRKEFIQVLRDRITLAIIIFMPFAHLLIFGFAINTDVKHLATAIFDQSRTQESREMITSFTSSNYFDIKLYAQNISEVNKAVESGKVKVGCVVERISGETLQDLLGRFRILLECLGNFLLAGFAARILRGESALQASNNNHRNDDVLIFVGFIGTA